MRIKRRILIAPPASCLSSARFVSEFEMGQSLATRRSDRTPCGALSRKAIGVYFCLRFWLRADGERSIVNAIKERR